MSSITEGLFPSVAGLFATPGAEAQKRIEQAYQPVDPMQGIAGNVRGAGQEFIESARTVFGPAPEDRKRQLFQQLVNNLAQQGVDISTPQGMVQLAQQMSRIPGLEGEALGLRQRAAQMAQQAETQGLEQDRLRAQTEQARASAAKSGRETDDLKAIGKSNTGQQVYRQGNEQFILGPNNTKVPYYGSLRKEQGDITVSTQQPKEILKNKSKQQGQTEENAVAAINQIANAQAISGVLNKAFTGVGSDVVLGVGKLADAFGITVSGTSESEQLDQLLAALTAGQARNLPGPLSEKELAFLKQSIGTRGVTRQTLEATVKRLEEAAYSDIIANNRLQKYIDEGNDLNAFNFATNESKSRELARLLAKATPEQRRQILGE